MTYRCKSRAQERHHEIQRQGYTRQRRHKGKHMRKLSKRAAIQDSERVPQKGHRTRGLQCERAAMQGGDAQERSSREKGDVRKWCNRMHARGRADTRGTCTQ